METYTISSSPFREAPEPTGEEPEDADLEAPKIYEMVNELCHCVLLTVSLLSTVI